VPLPALAILTSELVAVIGPFQTSGAAAIPFTFCAVLAAAVRLLAAATVLKPLVADDMKNNAFGRLNWAPGLAVSV